MRDLIGRCGQYVGNITVANAKEPLGVFSALAGDAFERDIELKVYVTLDLQQVL